MAMAQAEPPMPPANAEVQIVWAYIEKGLNDAMMDNRTGFSYARGMNLHTAVYNYCGYSAMRGNLGHNSVSGRRNMPGWDLYDKLKEYLITHLTSIRNASDSMVDEALLRYYAREWDQYATSARFLNRAFLYLNTHWVKRERDEGMLDVYPAYILAVVQWKQKVLLHIQNRRTNITSVVLKLIESQRNGEMIDHGLLKIAIESFITLGFDEKSWDLSTSLDLYKTHFEDPFITTSEKYYKIKSKSLLSQITLSDYLKRVEQELREEEDRVERYINAKTRKLHLSKCTSVLIGEQLDEIWEEIQRLRAYDEDEDLHRMYALLARIPTEYERVRKDFEESVERAGQAAISNLVGEGDGSVDSLEPKAYVDALLQVYRKKQHMVQRSFRDETGFVAAFDKACKSFINKNAVTSGSTTSSSELLVKRADGLLRKSTKVVEEGEYEEALDQVMILFKYIDDKDVFQSFYTTRLSKRLVHGVSVSDEAEASMISRLKDACGFEYTDKLQCMLLDMSLGKDLSSEFKEHIRVSGDGMSANIDLSFMILGANRWPLKAPAGEFIIPPEILPIHQTFVRYFQSVHSGRKLIWLWNYSTNELTTNYLNQKYTLRTSSYQMAILIQYNDNDTLSLKELMDATGIAGDLLLQILSMLVRAKILINDEDSDQYDLNPNFKSKKTRLNLNLPIKAQVQREAADTVRTVEEDRKYVIQAAIIRIMKARNTLSSQALIQEVVSQLSRRFTPKVSDIKKAIDSLLEKEHIERAEGHQDTFNYVA